MFVEKLTSRILKSLFVFHEDNYDEARFGPLPKDSTVKRLRQKLKGIFRRRGLYRVEDVFNPGNQRQWEGWVPHFPELDWLYPVFADEQSRSLLVDVIAYRIMGFHHVRLPLSTPEYWEARRRIRELAVPGERLLHAGGGFELCLQDLTTIGFPMRMFMPLEGPFVTFMLGQYACPRLGMGVRTGDVVIDAGACWGDTTLYFAHKAGESGRVYAFEFVAENLEILRDNLELNPELAARIEMVEAPVWSSSGVPMGNTCSGPGAEAKPVESSVGIRSLSIDDMVRQKRLERVDFIKMDIEGAEYDALKGAVATIQAHRPDLALCVYHSPDDFTRLARFVDDLNLGYQFSLGHFTIHAEETVLYATARGHKS